MAKRKHYKAINIDVEPFLSIMAIVMKLISLILVVILMRIVVNPKAMKVIAFSGLWEGSRGNTENPKEPTYLDCFENKVVIYSTRTSTNDNVVTWEALQRPGNVVDQIMDRIQENRDKEYIIIMARPKSVKIYRAIRKMLGQRPIDIGYDAVDADFAVNWDEANKALAVAVDAPEPAGVAPSGGK